MTTYPELGSEIKNIYVFAFSADGKIASAEPEAEAYLQDNSLHFSTPGPGIIQFVWISFGGVTDEFAVTMNGTAIADSGGEIRRWGAWFALDVGDYDLVSTSLQVQTTPSSSDDCFLSYDVVSYVITQLAVTASSVTYNVGALSDFVDPINTITGVATRLDAGYRVEGSGDPFTWVNNVSGVTVISGLNGGTTYEFVLAISDGTSRPPIANDTFTTELGFGWTALYWDKVRAWPPFT